MTENKESSTARHTAWMALLSLEPSTGGQETFVVRWARTLYLVLRDVRRLFALLPDAAKFCSMLLLKSVVVSFLIGLLTTPATAFYAARFGIRVPIEGAPYLQFTLGLWSFIAFIMSIVIVFVFVAIMIYLLAVYNSTVNKVEIFILSVFDAAGTVTGFGPIRLSKRMLKAAHDFIIDFNAKYAEAAEYVVRKILAPASWFFFLLGIIAYIFLSIGLFSEILPKYYYWFIFTMFSSFMFFYTNWFVYMQKPLWMIQYYLTPPLVIIMVVTLFAYDTYGSLLRVIRFGGGVEATLQLDGVGFRGTSEINGNLLMRSSTTVFLLVDDNVILEIPSEKVSLISLRYDAPWKMPSASMERQQKYILIE